MAIRQGLDGLLALGLSNITRQRLGQGESTQSFDDHVWEAEDGLTWSHGRHTFKFGGQYWRDIIKTFYAGNNGELGYDGFQWQVYCDSIPRLRGAEWRRWSGFCAWPAGFDSGVVSVRRHMAADRVQYDRHLCRRHMARDG